MKIISLTAENVKKLVAVHIKPDGNVVQITGRNGQGKTSVLDSIWWCLAGSGTIQSAPIRTGQQRAKIRLDLGELIVTRTFTRKDGGDYTTQIAVETTDGARYPSPQAMIDGLLGALSFDPLAFSRMKPRDQFDALRAFVPGIDFEKVDAQNRGDFQRRTDANRLAKEARAAASMIIIPEGTPDELLDENALVQQLKSAGDANADIERRRANREKHAAQIQRLLGVRASVDARIEAYARDRLARAQDAVSDLEAQIELLRKRIDATNQAANEDIRSQREQAAVEALNAEDEANTLQAKLDAAGPLPELNDTRAITEQIEQARQTNQAIRRKHERAKHVVVAERYEAEAKALSESMAARTKVKEDAISAAQMPVEGLGFGSGEILLNGVPFEQASDAERLRTSVAIAMASNPKLKVIRIRDGSLLDEDAMKLLGQMAEERGFQVWVERVDSSGTVGFVLEDGHVKTPPVTEPEREIATA